MNFQIGTNDIIQETIKTKNCRIRQMKITKI